MVNCFRFLRLSLPLICTLGWLAGLENVSKATIFSRLILTNRGRIRASLRMSPRVRIAVG
jgi:hypothetical protein